MKPSKICAYCHEPFVPYAFHYRRQRACSKPECQKQRRRDTNRTYYWAHRYDRDYGWEKNKIWRQEKGRDFMRQYRIDHPDYVKRNRRLQRGRNRRNRGMIVKSDVEMLLYAGKLMRIHLLESDCKVRRIRLLPE